MAELGLVADHGDVRFQTMDPISLAMSELGSLQMFLHDVMVETDAKVIATGFYPVRAAA